MQINLTLIIQFCNVLITIFAIKRWLVLPFLEYQEQWKVTVNKLVVQETEMLETLAQLNKTRVDNLVNFQTHSREMLTEQQKSLVHDQREANDAFKNLVSSCEANANEPSAVKIKNASTTILELICVNN